jgi:hypothetical protein
MPTIKDIRNATHPVKKNKQQINDTELVNTNFNPQFTKEEAIWMMGLIKDCTFNGIDVQKVYESVVKLQLIVNESE